MESKNRNVWIAVIVGLVVLCCIAAVVGAVLVGWLVNRVDDLDLDTSWETGWEAGRESERTELTFDLGATPDLAVDNFAGNVTVRAGEGNTVRVIATKKARRATDMDDIDIDWEERDGGLRIETSHRRTAMSNVSVEFEITVPVAANLDVDTGAGNVDIQDVSGEMRIHSGAGNVAVRGASGPVRLDTGAGNIDYEGTPLGDCTFQTGAGNITLELAADVNVEVDLDTGIGNVSVHGFEVAGTVSRGQAEGVIGTGAQGSIRASTGAGNIDLFRR